MLVADDKLLGWLVFLRLNIDEDRPLCVPTAVRLALTAKGWIAIGEETDEARRLHVTEAGCAASDLAAPEWGIDPLFGTRCA